MDELLQHCMRELAFDGDLGCDVSRLRQFVHGFYASRRSAGTQNVDDAFHTFVWRLLVHQPSVHVGLVGEGGAREVYIAPQISKRKAVAKPKKKNRKPEPAPFPALDGQDEQSMVTNDVLMTDLVSGRLQPIPEAASSPLESLVRNYGDSLRVAVDPGTCFRAITGTHIRPAKLSPMVYTALQFISRGREDGMSVVDLGKKTGYDQRTCFYLVLQLVSLDLVVKLSKSGPGGANFCIHKYFYSQSAFWKSVREENEEQDDRTQRREKSPEHEGSVSSCFKPQLDPIDSRHLASIEFVRSRVVKLLKNSKNGLHSYSNLIVSIGFSKPTRRDRRFFTSRIRELIRDNVIEKVIVPKMQGSPSALCIRLVADPRTESTEGIVVQAGEVEDEEQDEENLEDKDHDASLMPVTNMTMHRQLLGLLDRAGPEGLTLNGISARLGNFDKRSVEQILYRLERFPPPPHLVDLATCDFLENQGRERRHRYYTLTGYLAFIHNENIDDAGRTSRYTSMDTSLSGGFYPQPDQIFYRDPASLIKYEDEYKGKGKLIKEGPSRKLGRPRKDDASSQGKASSKNKATSLATERRGKEPIVQQDDRDQAQVKYNTAPKGTKRKRGEKPELDAFNSELQPPPKKKQAVENSSAHRNGALLGSMNVNDNTSAKSSELPGDGRSAILAAPRVEGPGSQDSQLNTPDTSSHRAHNLSELSLPMDRALYTRSGPNPVLEVPAMSKATPLVMEPSPIPRDPTFRVQRTPITDESAIGSKRTNEMTIDGLPQLDIRPAKRPKTGRPKRLHDLVNISQLRAENEIKRVVDESGGIANVSSKEFLETYARVISSMVEAGEPTSMSVNNQPDRRTIRKLLDRLIDRGKLKTLTTTITSRTTQSRLVKLIYDPSVTQEKLDEFVSAIREDIPVPGSSLRQLDQPLHYTRPKLRRFSDLVFNRDESLESGNEQDSRRDIDLSGGDDDVVRSSFLSEGQVVAQIYGYLVGKARRARELHQTTLAHLQSLDPSSYVVSQSERIVAFPHFFHDVQVSTYCAIVSVTEYSTELSQLMKTLHGRQTLIRDLSTNLSDHLKIGRARSRAAVLGLLDILTALKLVTPLHPTNGTTPYLSCEPKGTHPFRFDIAPATGDKGTTAMTESYWRFNLIAPIFLFAETDSWPPPFHRDMFVRTADESMQFWVELEDAFLKKQGLMHETSMDSITGPCECSAHMIRALQRRQSWISSYVLSRRQKQYLEQKWTRPSTGYTPLSDEDGGRHRVKCICDIISAPFDTVYAFFVTMRERFANGAKRIAERGKLRQESYRERQETEDKALLAKKAKEARRRLEADWDALVSRIHPTPLPYGSSTRLKALRARYLQSRVALTLQQWEAAVTEAISGSKSGKRNPLLPFLRSSSRKSSIRTRVSRLSLSDSGQQKSVYELIERYKDKATAGNARSQDKLKDKETDDNPDIMPMAIAFTPSHRHRFQWTPEYDELARDASAVIRARCRTWHRMDWTAIDQLFPFLPRNNVRQRLVTLRQEAGGQSYLSRLEDKWHELWLKHRGTEALPDENPGHPFHFDVIAHVEFLRSHIDKRALKAGLSKGDVHTTGAVLTNSLSDFLSKWDLKEIVKAVNNMDFMWSSIGDEHRQKTLLKEAFSAPLARVFTPTDSLMNGVAESLLKMTLTTREVDYDASYAAHLLDAVGQEEIREASRELLSRGVISEMGNRRRKTPGRKLRISDLNEDAIGGSFPLDFFSDACAIEDNIEDDIPDWREWAPVATDGELGAFIELVSEGKIGFHIDVSEAALHRQELDWNSRKVDDDQIETTLYLRYQAAMADAIPSPPPSPVPSTASDIELDGPDLDGHGLHLGVPAPCRKSSKGIITCMGCIDIEQRAILTTLELEERALCLDIIERLDKAGRQGMSYECFATGHLSSRSMHKLVRRLTSSKYPLCYWVGYGHPVLVDRRHIQDWTVLLPGSPLHLVFPRRWLNIKGEIMEDIWAAGLRAVVGVLVNRPGIPQAELRRKLVSVYDRQELNDLLEYLWREEVAVRHAESEAFTFKDIREIGGPQEQEIYWSLGAGAWYRVNEQVLINSGP